jgi:hypothetical protein
LGVTSVCSRMPRHIVRFANLLSHSAIVGAHPVCGELLISQNQQFATHMASSVPFRPPLPTSSFESLERSKALDRFQINCKLRSVSPTE